MVDSLLLKELSTLVFLPEKPEISLHREILILIYRNLYPFGNVEKCFFDVIDALLLG